MHDLERAARVAVDVGYHIHMEIGPGLLESVYEAIMADELAARGLAVQRQRLVPIIYQGRIIENALRADLIVEGILLVELKSTEQILPFTPNRCSHICACSICH